MADNDSRLLRLGTDDAPQVQVQNENQLTFAFATAGERDVFARHLPQQSRQEMRSRNLGRSLVAPKLDRPVEEIQLEHGVACHIPPGKLLDLRLTENRYTIISVRRGQQCYRVRVHRMFAGVEPRLVRALARYVVHNDQRASVLLSEYIEQHQAQIRRQPPRTRRVVLRTQGTVHDLGAVFEKLNRRYFDGKLDLRITWGTARRRQPQRSIKVGAFLVEDRLIRVHPVLDQELVPRFFLEWIVFHEMLHAKHAIRRVHGRRCFHPPEFTQEERLFPDYARARLWEKANLDWLLS
jgi:hypothetical protein